MRVSFCIWQLRALLEYKVEPTKMSSDLDQELAQWHIYYIKLEDQEVWLIGRYLAKQLQSIAILAFIWLSQAPWRP